MNGARFGLPEGWTITASGPDAGGGMRVAVEQRNEHGDLTEGFVLLAGMDTLRGRSMAKFQDSIARNGMALPPEAPAAENTPGSKTYGIRVAKATSQDVDTAQSIASMIENLHKGYYPGEGEDDPVHFDEDDERHLRAFYDRAMALTESIGAGLSRVAMAAHCALHNELYDPALDYLAINPRLVGTDTRVLTCVYCGHEYPQDTPAAGDAVLTAHIMECEKHPLRAAMAELERLRALINTPELYEFSRGAALEAAHQRERWGTQQDAGKTPPDWFWLVGYLAGKALNACVTSNTEKALHHCISTAAALSNWHASIIGADTSMRPGIEPPAEASEEHDDFMGDLCPFCCGDGSVATGITEAPSTICETCDGTGKAGKARDA